MGYKQERVSASSLFMMIIGEEHDLGVFDTKEECYEAFEKRKKEFIIKLAEKTKKKDKMNKAEKANKMDIKKMTALAMFSVIALTIFTAESMIGPIVPIPGIKLGLANIVTLLVLVLYGPKEAVFVLIVRILLGSMFGGQMISFFYSLSGGILCWLVMSLISALLKKKFLVLISMCGAAAHNIGQILAAIVITHSISVVAYLPVMMLCAMITGCFTGLAAQVCSKRLQKILRVRFF